MSGLALYGTCDAIVGETVTGQDKSGHLITRRITCNLPATHEAADNEGQLNLCDEHTHQVLRDPGHATVRRLDQGGTG